MTNRLSDILDEVDQLQQQVATLLQEAVTLSGRKVGDDLTVRGRKGCIVRLEAQVASPWVNGARRKTLSIHAVCSLYRLDGMLSKRVSVMLIEPLAHQWRKDTPPPADTFFKGLSTFEHGLQAMRNGAGPERRRPADRRSGDRRFKENSLVKKKL